MPFDSFLKLSSSYESRNFVLIIMYKEPALIAEVYVIDNEEWVRWPEDPKHIYRAELKEIDDGSTLYKPSPQEVADYYARLKLRKMYGFLPDVIINIIAGIDMGCIVYQAYAESMKTSD